MFAWWIIKDGTIVAWNEPLDVSCRCSPGSLSGFCVMYPKVAHGSEGEGSWWWQQSRLSLAFSCLWHSLLKDPVRRDYCEDASSRSFFVCFFGGLSVSFGVSLLHTYWSAHMGHSLCLGCNFCIFFFDSSKKNAYFDFLCFFFFGLQLHHHHAHSHLPSSYLPREEMLSAS